MIPHSVAISVCKTKKPFTDDFTDGICASKKKIPASIIPTDCYSVGDITIHRRLLSVGNLIGELLKYRQNIPFVNSSVSYNTDGINPSVNLLVSHENTNRIYPSGNLSVMVAATV